MAIGTLDSIVRADECYPLQVFKRLTGMGNAAMRESRRRGLVVRKVGLRSYVLGKDWLRFVEEHGKPVE